MKPEIVAVTGAAGFVGSHAALALLAAGRQVVALDVQPFPVNLAPPADRELLTAIELDICDAASLANIFDLRGVEAVIHAAGLVRGEDALSDAEGFLRANAIGTWSVCQAVRSNPLAGRTIIVSSRAVYGGFSADRVTENAPYSPSGLYGASKVAGDVVACVFREQLGLEIVVARLTRGFGPLQTHPRSILRLTRSAVDGGPLEISPLEPEQEYVYIKDSIRGLLTLLDCEKTAHAIYNVAGGCRYSARDLTAAIQTVVPGVSVRVTDSCVSSPPDRSPMAHERMRVEFGFEPRWTLEEGVREMIAWLRTGDYGSQVRL